MYILLFLIIILAILLAFISQTNSIKTGGGIKQLKEPMEIFIVRHGETDINKVGGNNLPETPLNENGIKQAIATGKYLATLRPFDVIYASPTKRTTQTAELIIKELKDTHIIYDERIQEGDRGNLDIIGDKDTFDQILEDFKAQYPDPIDFEDNFNELDKTLSKDYKFESMKHFQDRIHNFFNDLKQKNHKRVLIVSHRGAILTTLFELLKVKIPGAARKTLDNCSIMGIRETNGKYEMVFPWSVGHIKKVVNM